MKKKLICLLVAGALPGIALADSTSAEIKALQAQVAALQKQMKAMQAQLSAKGGPATAQAGTKAGAGAAPAAVAIDPEPPDYGKAQATLTNDEVGEMKQQIANQQLKVDSLTDAANTGARRPVGDGLHRPDLHV